MKLREQLKKLRLRSAQLEGKPEDNVDSMTTALGPHGDLGGGFAAPVAPTNWVPSQQDERPRH